MKNWMSFVALLLAGIAIVISGTSRGPKRPADAKEEAFDFGPIVARIESRIEEIERRLTECERSAARSSSVSLSPSARESAPLAPTTETTELETRLAELEGRLKQFSVNEKPARGLPEASLPSERKLDLGERQRVARDGTRTEEERLRALGDLRGQLEADGTDARLAVLDDMLLLAQLSTNPKTRADVWRQLSHVTDARLRRPLLDALALDPNAKAREEAAETLADFLPDAQVEAALRAAAQNDADAAVRRQAAASLAGGR